MSYVCGGCQSRLLEDCHSRLWKQHASVAPLTSGRGEKHVNLRCSESASFPPEIALGGRSGGGENRTRVVFRSTRLRQRNRRGSSGRPHAENADRKPAAGGDRDYRGRQSG